MSAPAAYQTTHVDADGTPQTAPPPKADDARAAPAPEDGAPLLGLPAPRPAQPGDAPPHLLDLSDGRSATVSLTHLGPVVVGVDGTLSRIGNWGELTEAERERTARRIADRNNARLAALRADSTLQAPLD